MTFPRGLIEMAGPAAWLAPLPGLALALLAVYIFWLLLKPHPDKTIVEITEAALDPVMGTIVNVIYVIFKQLYHNTKALSIAPMVPLVGVNEKGMGTVNQSKPHMFGDYLAGDPPAGGRVKPNLQGRRFSGKTGWWVSLPGTIAGICS